MRIKRSQAILRVAALLPHIKDIRLLLFLRISSSPLPYYIFETRIIFEWFYTHCNSMHRFQETQRGVIDTAVWAMRHIKRNVISLEVTSAVKNDFAKLLSYHNKCFGGLRNCHLYGDPICDRLAQLRDDRGFTEKELYRRHKFEEDVLLGKKKRPTRIVPLFPNAASPSTQTVSSQVPTPQTANTSSKRGSADPPSSRQVSTQPRTPIRQSVTTNLEENSFVDHAESAPKKRRSQFARYSPRKGTELAPINEANLSPSRQAAAVQPPPIDLDLEPGADSTNHINGLYFRPKCTSECIVHRNSDNPCKDQHSS